MTGELAPLSLAMESFREVLKKPLRLLPESVRPAALRVWTCNRHLVGLETPLALCARLAVWIGDYGLQANDASQLLNEMLSPESSSKHRFASDLLADLAAAVKERIRMRRNQEEAARRRDEDGGLKQTPREVLNRIYAGIGQMPKD